MNIRVIAVGKLKEDYLRREVDILSKKINKKTKFEIIEVSDERTPDGASEKEELIIKNKEGERILSKIPDNSYIITLEIKGKSVNSKELKEKISGISKNDIAENIVFIVGGSLGLSDSVSSVSNFKISFSRMTFPHQLMRYILLTEIEKIV